MKRRQLLLTLCGVPVIGSLIYAAIAKSKNQYEPYDPVLAKSPDRTATPNSEVKTPPEPSEKPLLRFAAIADTGVGSKDQYAVANAMLRTYQQDSFPFVLMAGDNIYPYGENCLWTSSSIFIWSTWE